MHMGDGAEPRVLHGTKWYLYTERLTDELRQTVRDNNGQLSTIESLRQAYKYKDEEGKVQTAVVGLDCKGVNLSLLGQLTTALLCINKGPGHPDNRVDVVDLGPPNDTPSVNPQIREFLASVLECTDITKCAHDSVCVSGALHASMGIQLRTVFDTSVAHRVMTLSKTHTSLRSVLPKYGLAAHPSMTARLSSAPEYWTHPLDIQRLERAVADVYLLPDLYRNMEVSVVLVTH